MTKMDEGTEEWTMAHCLETDVYVCAKVIKSPRMGKETSWLQVFSELEKLVPQIATPFLMNPAPTSQQGHGGLNQRGHSFVAQAMETKGLMGLVILSGCRASLRASASPPLHMSPLSLEK